MKELPEKWRVKDCDIVSNWASKTFGCKDFVSSGYLCIDMETFPERSSYCFFSNRVGYTTYTKITLEDFKKLVLKEETMNKLPEEYIVECDKTSLEANEVLRTYYDYKPLGHKWNYVICRKDLSSRGIPVINAVENTIKSKYSKMPIFTYKQWKEMYYQKEETMPKQDFTIEGSEALKKAFVEESGLTNWTVGWYQHLTSSIQGKGFASTPFIMDKHFILPSQWEEALQYVKEYFAENEFKVGDWVLLSNYANGWGSLGIRNKILQITNIDLTIDSVYGGKYYFGDERTVGKEIIRKATLKEIAAAQTKTFKLGDFTAVVSKGKVEIAGRGSVTISECIKWFEEEFTIGNKYASLGEFAVTENTYTLNLGCVKNVPVKDIEVVYKYLKTL